MNLLKQAFPNKFFGCRVLSENVLSVSLNYNSIDLSLTRFTSISRIVTSVGSYSLESKPLINKFGEFDQATIGTVFSHVKDFCSKNRVDKVVLVVPSSICVFKELEVPFRDKHKIESIIDMQIDGVLPLDPQNMSYDFVLCPITKEGGNKVFLAAIESKNLVAINKLANKNGFEIDLITVDAFCYASALLQNVQPQGNQIILLVAGELSTKIIFIKDKGISFIKNLYLCYDSIFESLAQKFGFQPGAIKQQVLQLETGSGVENLELIAAFKSELTVLVQEALVNVQSISSKTGFACDRIYVFSELAQVAKTLLNLVGSGGGFVGVEVPQDGFLAKYNVKNRAVFSSASITSWQLPILAAIIHDSEFDFNVGKKILAGGASRQLQSKTYILATFITILFGYLFYISSFRISKIRTIESKESAVVLQEAKKCLSELGVTVGSRLDWKKVLAEYDKTVLDLNKSAFTYQGLQSNVLEMIFSITKCVEKYNQKVSVEKIKYSIDPEQKLVYLKVKGAFVKSISEQEVAQFFNFLKKNSKFDSFELKKQESSLNFSVTFVKKNE